MSFAQWKEKIYLTEKPRKEEIKHACFTLFILTDWLKN